MKKREDRFEGEINFPTMTAEDLRVVVKKEGDFPIPGWTLGDGETDTTALALLDRLDAECEAICAMIDRPITKGLST